MSEVITVVLSKEEARNLTDRIKESAEELWRMLLEAYEGQAHTVLGYSSWGSYYEAEYGGSARRGYALLDAGRVVKAIEDSSAACGTEVMPNARQADELASLVKEYPEEAAKVWEEVVEEHGDKLTATDVKQAAKERAEFKDRLAALPEKTRAVLEQADENFDKHRNLLRNSNQMNHLASIAQKHGDEVAAEVAERALTEEGSNMFSAYEDLREGEDVEDGSAIVKIVKVRNIEYVVKFGDGASHTVPRKTILEQGWKKCKGCKGHGVTRQAPSPETGER